MKNLFRLSMRITMLAAIAGMLTLAATPSMAAINKGTGNIAGIDANLDDSEDFVLNATTLKLVKRAFTATGGVIPDGSSVPTGTTVKFIIYVDNSTPVAINDVSIQDELDALFAYTVNSIKIDNTLASNGVPGAVCPGGVCDEDAIFTAIDDNTPLDDGVDATGSGDVASYDAGPPGTIDLGDEAVGNQQLDILANSVFAVQITVTVQ